MIKKDNIPILLLIRFKTIIVPTWFEQTLNVHSQVKSPAYNINYLWHFQKESISNVHIWLQIE